MGNSNLNVRFSKCVSVTLFEYTYLPTYVNGSLFLFFFFWHITQSFMPSSEIIYNNNNNMRKIDNVYLLYFILT